MKQRALRCFLVLAFIVPLMGTAVAQDEDLSIPTFQRGDVDANGSLNLGDVFLFVEYVFLDEEPSIACISAFDFDDNGSLSAADALAHLSYQFLAGAPLPEPFGECGTDATEDTLGCEEYPGCDPIVVPTVEMARTAHVLRRVAYGQTPGLFDYVLDLENGAEDYIAEQLDPESFEDPALLEDRIDGLNPDESLGDLHRVWILRALYSEAQLQEVLTDFWDNHFNTYYPKLKDFFLNQKVGNVSVYTETEAEELAAQFEWDENQFWRENGTGDFVDLLMKSATGVVMNVYLDNIFNVAGIPNENYAREVMELHTLGTDNLYNQADIEELARVFTGWTVCLVDEADADDPNAECEELVTNPEGAGLVWAFHFDPDLHDWDAKVIFEDDPVYEYEIDGVPVSERDGETGLAEGIDFLGYLAGLSQTGEYLTTKLVQKFVADDAPAGVVASGLGTWISSDGNIKEVLEDILLSDEFLGEEYRMNKVRTSLEYLVSTVRAFGGETDSQVTEITDGLEELDQLPMHRPFPDGYSELGDDQLGTGALLVRLRFQNMIPEEGDDVDYPDIRGIMIDHDVALNDSEEVTRFWMDRLFADQFTEADVQIGEAFLLTNEYGNSQELASWANLYDERIARFLGFLALYPQHFKQ